MNSEDTMKAADCVELTEKAIFLGATDAKAISSSQIVVSEKLSKICIEPGCPFRGLAASCPPAVGGPQEFITWISTCPETIVVRLDMLASILYSNQRVEVMALLHEIVAGVEIAAHTMGYTNSRAFAGGSCKELFCMSHARCRKLFEDGECRNPEKARPSMSGYGIDVGHLMKTAGWSKRELGRHFEDESGDKSMSWLAGLVLVG